MITYLVHVIVFGLGLLSIFLGIKFWDKDLMKAIAGLAMGAGLIFFSIKTVLKDVKVSKQSAKNRSKK